MKTSIMTTRFNFITGATSMALASCMTAGAATKGSRLRMGVLSDIHLSTPEFAFGEHDYNVLNSTPEMFERALMYFRERGVDAVAIAGDLTEYGMEGELERVAQIWRKVFPNDRGKDGEKVEKVFIYGNHDIVAWKLKSTWYGGFYEGAEKERRWQGSIAHDPAGAWKRCFGLDYAPLQIVDVKGYKFVLGHWVDHGSDPTKMNQPDSDVSGLDEFLTEHRRELEGDRPFFYLQHAHPKDTCLPFAPHDCGSAKRALSKFPNAVAFSGHAHQPLTDERGFWHGEFYSIGTASLIDAGGRNCRENGAPFAFGTVTDPRKTYLNTLDCRQGMYITVEDDHLTIERRDFYWGLQVAPNWTIPEVPHTLPLPQFPTDAKLALTPDKDEIKLSFPSANAGGRTYDYEAKVIQLADDYDEIVATRRILAPDYHVPAIKANRPATISIKLAALPHDAKLRFEVSPIDCNGRRGAAITSTWHSTSYDWSTPQ